MLDAMPPASKELETNALNVQLKAHTSSDSARLDDFEIEADLAEHRSWYVHGTALERFAQMTNWDYFEAVLRFQRVLKACGLWKTLEKRGVAEGDTVVIGEVEFRWSSEQREGQLYELWQSDLAARGRTTKGSARWPHPAA
jgi:GTPase